VDVGLFLHNHGVVTRAEDGATWTSVPVDEMRMAEVVQLADRLGYHSIWLSDHVFTTREEYAGGRVSLGLDRVRPPGCVMLDSLAMMAFAAACSTRIRLGTSILVAPYRHPLVLAHQLATIDVLSQGRVIAGVGAGWLESEFDALEVPYGDRFEITQECLEIYDLAWTQPWVTYRGRHFDFADVAVEPKPAQRPRIPLIYGGTSPAGARRAVGSCDGFCPRLAQEADDPAAHHDGLRETIRREAERTSRDLTEFRLLTLASCLLGDARAGAGRPFLSGSSEQLLGDLERLAAHGYSHCTLRLDVRSGEVDELVEAVARFGDEVLPQAAAIDAAPL